MGLLVDTCGHRSLHRHSVTSSRYTAQVTGQQVTVLVTGDHDSDSPGHKASRRAGHRSQSRSQQTAQVSQRWIQRADNAAIMPQRLWCPPGARPLGLALAVTSNGHAVARS